VRHGGADFSSSAKWELERDVVKGEFGTLGVRRQEKLEFRGVKSKESFGPRRSWGISVNLTTP